MTTKDRLYHWLNQATFNEDQGCRHPQDLLASVLGVDKRTIIRAIQALEAEDRIRVDRPRKRGQCNTYHVNCWNPTKRSGVLNVLRTIRQNRAKTGGCHPNRTATPVRALTTRSPLASLSLKDQRCGREDERNLRIVPNPGQPELDCAQCAAKDAEIRRLIGENTDLGTEIGGLLQQHRSSGRTIAKLTADLTKTREEGPDTGTVKTILAHWLRATGRHERKGRKPVVSMTSGRAELVRKRLRHYKPEDLMEAIDGVALCPYLMFGKRQSLGSRKDLRNELEDCIREDRWVDENRAAYRRMVSSAALGADWLHDAYRQASALESALGRLVSDAVTAAVCGVEPGEPLERWLVRRHRERDLEWVRLLADLEPSNVVPIRQDAA